MVAYEFVGGGAEGKWLHMNWLGVGLRESGCIG